jgi:hypothetical protein
MSSFPKHLNKLWTLASNRTNPHVNFKSVSRDNGTEKNDGTCSTPLCNSGLIGARCLIKMRRLIAECSEECSNREVFRLLQK